MIMIDRRPRVVCWVIALLSWFPFWQAEPQGAKAGPPKIEFRLSLAKRSFALGSPVRATVQIVNRSRETVLVPSEFNGLVSHIDVWLEDANGRPLPATSGALDTWGRRNEDFCGLLLMHWLPLAPGHSYGRTMEITPQVYVAAKKPGRYRVRARYVSRGLRDATHNNPLADHQDKIARLPFQDWEGKIESNAVWIEIISPYEQSSKQK